jgi:uncharacterized protein (DUF983 family)
MSERVIETLSGSIRAGLSCACPRCGQGKMFQGFLTLRPMEGLMIALQYHHKASEARFGHEGET